MADMEEIQPPTIECGFCLRKDMVLPNPRQLPCGHVHCLDCLTGFFEENNMLACPFEYCGEVCEVSIKELPIYDVAKNKPKSCDVCTNGEEETGPAVVYCVPCDKVFCFQHQKKHDDFYKEFGGSHKTMSMEEYELQKSSQQSRVCPQHGGKPISAGCRKCLKMICTGCLSTTGNCSDGKSHQMMCLEELVVELNDELNKLKRSMIEKEESLEKLFKFTSKTLADYDEETSVMLKTIQDKRDEQIKVLTLKFQQLEDELMQSRQETKTMMTDFLEDKVLAKWRQLRNYRRKAESRAQHAHECDVVSGYRETKNDIQRLAEEVLPALELPELSKVVDKDGSCEINLEVVWTSGYLLDKQLTLKPFKSPPSSIKLLHTIPLPSSPYSGIVWNSQILSGMGNNIVATIDSNYKVKSPLLTLKNIPKAMKVYKDRLYTAVSGKPWTIYVHDQQGKQVNSWSHLDNVDYSLGLAITSDKVVAPDRNNKLLIIYSLTGGKLKEISCPKLSEDWVSLCAAGPDKVVVSDYASAQVFMMDISRDHVLWTCKEVAEPLGVTCYRGRCVLVAAYNRSSVRVLDSSTGEVVSKLTSSDVRHTVFDLHISDRKLYVPLNSEKKLLIYQLQL